MQVKITGYIVSSRIGWDALGNAVDSAFPGEIIETDDETANTWIERGLATPVELESEPEPEPAESESYTCEICGREFTTKTGRTQHQKYCIDMNG